MAGANQVQQGTLNRLRGSVVVPTYPNLNITNGYLGKPGISVSLSGNATLFIDTMTGRVTSPEPYLDARVMVHLLRTQSLGALWRSQMETQLSTIGQISVVPDSVTFPTYDFLNCAIEDVAEMRFDGTDPGYVITLGGTYLVNASLWNLT